MRSCAEVWEPIELSFGVVSGEVGPSIDVQNGVHVAQGEGWIWGLFAQLFQWPNFKEKYIRLVHEKLRIFLYAQYIVGIYVSLAF